jgi:5-methylcytosine-specific restriction endonuclease McrA
MVKATAGRTVTPYEFGQCEICGRRSRSGLGVCQETPECRTEYNRRFHALRRQELREYKQQDRKRNLERERTRDRERYARNREARRALARRIRHANRERLAEQNRIYREANREALAERRREYMKRPGRQCRYAASGCTQYARPGGNCCQEHHTGRARRRRATKRRRLAGAQGGQCPWCTGPLPANLAGTQIDHIIPVSRGGTDQEWNLQLLHGRCNRKKWDQLTPRARALATEHGIALVLPEAA